MRPLYESSADRAREAEAVGRLATALGAKVHKLTGQYARLDYMVVLPGNIHAFVEIKCRNAGLGAYPTLMISAAKWREGISMAEATGGKFLIMAAYKDGDLVYLFDRKDVESKAVWCEFGGRTANTRDTGDIEPVMQIPTRLMLPLI